MNKQSLIVITLTVFHLLTTCSSLISQTESKSNPQNTSSSLYTIGYQIGGHTYIGVNYEYKIFKLIGFHAGLGYKGYTAGIKFHMNDCVECPQMNVSFKDGGFGSLGTFGAEFASRMFTFKKNGKLAAYAQFGFGYITYLSDEKRKELYGSKDPPEGIFTFGLGLNFW